jgi:antitoxin component HigA of HigAB toxin-antitoxin module
MSRGKIARKVSKARIAITYYQLCMQYLPRPIRDKSGYESALERIDSLVGLTLNAEQEDYLHILSQQIAEYDRNHVLPPARLSGVEMLKFACQETGISRTRLARVLDVSESLVSLIFKGDRNITVEIAAKLGSHFGVDPVHFVDGLY